MGYSEIWTVKDIAKWEEAWPRLVADARIIIDAADADLTGDRVWDMRDVEDRVKSGDMSREEAVEKLLNPPPPVVDVEQGIKFNGIQDHGCEYFFWVRNFGKDGRTWMYDEKKGGWWERVKTNERPYTVVVAALLIRASQIIGDSFECYGLPLIDPDKEHPCWTLAAHLIRTLWPDDIIPEKIEANGQGSTPALGSSPKETQSPDERQSSGDAHSDVVSAGQYKEDGRCLGNWDTSVVGSTAMVKLARQWIRSCINEPGHDSCREKDSWSPSGLMRLIDVEDFCIVKAPTSPRYVAMSYVWGKKVQARLLRENAKRLHQKQGLGELKLSRAVRETIWLCRQLGYQYLWVDALCIIQDNPQDALFQIKGMRDVYRGAEVTIVAARGSGAEFGILEETQHPRGHTRDNALDVEKQFREAIGKTVWNTRGWTFQEMCLSRRLLVFTSGGLFYHCATHIYSESGKISLKPLELLPEAARFTARPGWVFNVPTGRQLETYLAAVQNYAARELTFDSDVERAMRGITRAFGFAMDGKPNNFYLGLPTSAFDALMGWRAEMHEPSRRRPEFPSWSWYGWNQVPLFPDNLMQAVERKRNCYGSVMVAFDRHIWADAGKWAGTKLDPTGINTDLAVTVQYLFLRVDDRMLCVSRESEEDVGDTNGLFTVSIPDSEVVIGQIQLDKTWRAQREDKMLFFPLLTATEGSGVRIHVLMCVVVAYNSPEEKMERCKEGKGDYERVQVMDCNIDEEIWVTGQEKEWNKRPMFLG